MSGESDVLPCDSCPHSAPLSVRLTKIEDRLERLDGALFGNGVKKGVIEHVEALVDITKVGRSTFRVFMYAGGAIVALATAFTQLKLVVMGMFH
jgi:hypothetical protein